MGVELEKLGEFILIQLRELPEDDPDREFIISMSKRVKEKERNSKSWRASREAGTISEEGRVNTVALAQRINRECAAQLQDETKLSALYYWDEPDYQEEVPEDWENLMENLTTRERGTIRREIGSILRANRKEAIRHRDVSSIETVGEWRRAQTDNSEVFYRIRARTRELLMITFRNVEAEGEIPRSA